MYLDDLLVASNSVEEHRVKLEEIFDRLVSAGLTINLPKCSFFQSSLSFLGHTISSKGISPNNGKIDSSVIPSTTYPKASETIFRTYRIL